MKRDLTLTAEELFLLGKMLQAKYLDYAYIRIMGDFTRNYKLFEKKNQAELIKKNVLILKDFKGNVEVAPWAKDLIMPVFEGMTETTLDIRYIENNILLSEKYHYYEGNVIKVSIEEGNLNICRIELDMIKERVNKILSEKYNADKHILENVDERAVSEIYIVKKLTKGQASIVNAYLKANDTVYKEIENGRFESLSREEFGTEIWDVLKGE